jgi:phosphoribosylaminoimidazolecarboxamide formyltransferase/IMP cyclohydrolase
MIRRALVSTTNMKGLVDFCTGLHKLCQTEFVATDSAGRLLIEAGLPTQLTHELTGLPKGFLGGLVKTLHPSVHGGILGPGSEHEHELAEQGVKPFTMVIVNFYDFPGAVAGQDSLVAAKAATDIGGPAMLRAAAKNWEHVVPVFNPIDYPEILDALRREKDISRCLRLRLAIDAFAHTSAYDSAISAYLLGQYHLIDAQDCCGRM